MMKTFNRWFPSFTLAAWSSILLYFYGSGRLAAFLHPTFRPGVLVAGIVLLLLAIGSAVGSGRNAAADCCEDDACGHPITRPAFGKFLAFAVLLLPVLMVFGTAHDSFGLSTIQNRGVIMDAAGIIANSPHIRTVTQPDAPAAPASKDNSPYVETPLPTNDPNAAVATTSGTDGNTGTNDSYIPKTASGNIAASVIDLLYAAQDPSLRSDFDGKTVEVVGQLMADKESNPTGNRMKVVRMFMTCCAADAKPVAALIEFPAGMAVSDAPELSWVRIVGVPKFPTEDGRPMAVLHVTSLKVTDPPEESMLY